MVASEKPELSAGLRRSQERDFPYFRRLWNSIVVALLAASFIPMILIGGGMYHYAVSSLEERTLGDLRMEVSEHREALDQFLTERTMDLELLAETLGLEFLTRPGMLEKVFSSLQGKLPCFTDLGVINAQGRHLAYVGPYNLLSKGYKDAPWFKALQERHVHISDVFLGFRNEPHFVIAVKQETKENFWIIRATVDTVYFDNLVSEILSERSGDAFLVSKDRLFQTSPRQGGSLMGQWGLKLPGPFEGVKMEEKGGHLFMMSWLQRVPWLCVAEFDRSEIYASLHRIRNIGIFVLVLGGILILLTAMLTTNYLVTRLETKQKSIRFLDQQLRHSSRVASSMQLASAFAREINDTLSNIDLVSRWIEDLSKKDLSREENRKEIKESLNEIKSEVARTRRITGRFFKATQRTFPLVKELNANEILDEIVGLLDRELRFKKITVRREYDEELPLVRSDASQLRQVFQNLILNAVTAVDKEGAIELMTAAGENSVRITVKDSGSGISQEHIGKIFDPLFTTKPEGTGLGLSISADIVKKLGGRIAVESERGKGATFTVELPLQFTPTKP
ncbi:MAG: ATP-binding protein [Deltaproteobacteria bacterium]